MSLSLAWPSVTVNWPLSPGSDALASLALIDTVVESSSAIVTVATLADGLIETSGSSTLIKVRMTSSLSSKRAWSTTFTSMVAVNSPARIVTVRAIDAKSVPSMASPVTV